MLDEYTIEMLPERIYQRLCGINAEYLDLIGHKINEIGHLRPTDVIKLQQMYSYGGDVDKIAARLADVSQKNVTDIYDMFDVVAQENYNFAKPFYEAVGKKFVPYAENVQLQKYVKTLARQTVNEYANITQHTAFAIFEKGGKNIAPLFSSNADKVATSLSDTYTAVMDIAVTKSQLGMTDYRSSMREVLRAMSDSGIRSVDYATGYTRRLDSSVRQNVLWGIKQCNQGTADLVGEEFGADGYEISFHSHPRPSHAAMGGQQYVIGPARKVGGVYYPSFSDVEPLLEDFGCLHFKFSILVGMSNPTYSKEQLETLKEQDRQKFEYEGKEYTKYEASQVQRKLETEMRRQKDRANIAKAAGDDDMRREAQSVINNLTVKYKDFSNASGLPTKLERAQMSGFKRVKTKDELTKSAKSNIINLYQGKGIDIVSDKAISQDIIQRIDKATKKVTSDFKILEKYSEPIRFGDVEGGLAENSFNPKTGLNQITLRKSDFANPNQLLLTLKSDFNNGLSYETNNIESLVAHEMGHNAHVALALKRSGTKYGEPLTPIQHELFKKEYNKIKQEIYLVTFSNESYVEIQTKCINELGIRVDGNASELVAQSFGNHYFGKNISPIAKKIIKYFMKGLK